MYRRSVLSVLLTLIVGCVSAPKAPAAADAAAKTFSTPEGKAQLYVVRPSSFGLAVLYQMAVDGRLIGSLPAETFLTTPIAGGSHNVSVFNNTSQENLAVTCEINKTCFVRVGMHPAATSNRPRLKQVTEDEGPGLVRSNAMVETLPVN